MKHTPGPWQLLPRTEDLPAYVCKDANDKLNTEIAVIYRATDDCDANARLIAAAPELLEALEACFSALNNEGRYQGERSQASRALAKAKGTS
jgi:hypothetical protein